MPARPVGPDDIIWARVIRTRPIVDRVAINTMVYLHRMPPGGGCTEVRELLRQFRADLREAGWRGPHAPGRGGEPIRAAGETST